MQAREPNDRQDEEDRQYRLLKNPLPEPARRSHVRMEFDVETKDQDEFDIDIPEDDDFDI